MADNKIQMPKNFVLSIFVLSIESPPSTILTVFKTAIVRLFLLASLRPAAQRDSSAAIPLATPYEPAEHQVPVGSAVAHCWVDASSSSRNHPVNHLRGKQTCEKSNDCNSVSE